MTTPSSSPLNIFSCYSTVRRASIELEGLFNADLLAELPCARADVDIAQNISSSVGFHHTLCSYFSHPVGGFDVAYSHRGLLLSMTELVPNLHLLRERPLKLFSRCNNMPHRLQSSEHNRCLPASLMMSRCPRLLVLDVYRPFSKSRLLSLCPCRDIGLAAASERKDTGLLSLRLCTRVALSPFDRLFSNCRIERRTAGAVRINDDPSGQGTHRPPRPMAVAFHAALKNTHLPPHLSLSPARLCWAVTLSSRSHCALTHSLVAQVPRFSPFLPWSGSDSFGSLFSFTQYHLSQWTTP